VLAFTSAPAEEVSTSDEAAGGASDSRADDGGGGGGARIGGRVETREDVIKAIDAICDYYRRREPASPVFQIMARAREWVNLDFLSLLADIAPGSVDEVKRILMAQPKPDAAQPAQSSGW
jgi:type VI secretion system protein ImpA